MLHVLVLLGVVGGPAPDITTHPAPTLAAVVASGVDDASGVPVDAVAETLIVTATLEETSAEEAPAAATVIFRDEILARQEPSIADLLRTAPGLDVVRSGSPGKATSVFSRGANSNQTLVLWNGVQLNDPFFGGFDWAFLPTDGVDRVEVIRSPASVVYGSDAVGGVVQVVGAGVEGLDVRAEAGSDDYARLVVAGGTDLGGARLDVAGHARHGDGELDNDGYDGEDVTARMGWSFGEDRTAGGRGSVGVLLRRATSEVGLPFDGLGNPSPRRLQERDTTQVAVPVQWRRGRWKVRGQVMHHALDLEVSNPDDPFGASASEAEALDARAVATRHFGDGHWVAFGADWERQEASSRSSFGTGLAGNRQSTRAGFGEVHLDRGPWSLDLGLRRDDNDAFGAETTARAGVLRRFGRQTVRAAFAQGFRAPSLGDLYFPGFSNPDLRPETSDTFELAWSVAASGWTTTLTGFSTDVEQLIVFDPVTTRPENVGRARSRGVEGELAWEGDGFWGRLSATWLEAEDRDTGEPLVRRPDWRGSVAAGWRHDDWDVTGTLVQVGDRIDLGGVDLEGYTIVDLSSQWQTTPVVAPYARVENVFDERYEEAAGFPGPDRAFVVGLAIGPGGR